MPKPGSGGPKHPTIDECGHKVALHLSPQVVQLPGPTKVPQQHGAQNLSQRSA
jgi:hypothetical protein